MSDDEFSYEYDEDDDNEFEYEDEDEEQDADDGAIRLENGYYNAKGLRETDLGEAAEEFEKVIAMEREELSSSGSGKQYGQWAYKCLKQLVKLYLRSGKPEEIIRHYNRMLECIAGGEVSQNAIEKGINGHLDRISSLLQGNSSTESKNLANNIYEATINFFDPKKGSVPNDRLWFKTNLKYGQLLYETNETEKLQQVLFDLKRTQDVDSTGTGTSSSASTHLMEIYALQIQLYSRQKDNKNLRLVFNKALAVRGGIPHPRTLALIQELGGKMHMASREYEPAGKTFFQAFKSYDEAGDPSRLRCLKYLVMASMLHASTINPFDSQEARPYRDDPQIVAMTNLVQAFHGNDIHSFEKILRENQGRIMEDEFVREHVEELLRTIRRQVLRRAIQPYTRISLEAISKELNNIPVKDVESLLIGLILDGLVEGEIDQVEGILVKQSGSQVSSSRDTLAAQLDAFKALEEMASTIEEISLHATGTRLKESTQMRGMAH